MLWKQMHRVKSVSLNPVEYKDWILVLHIIERVLSTKMEDLHLEKSIKKYYIFKTLHAWFYLLKMQT